MVGRRGWLRPGKGMKSFSLSAKLHLQKRKEEGFRPGFHSQFSHPFSLHSYWSRIMILEMIIPILKEAVGTMRIIGKLHLWWPGGHYKFLNTSSFHEETTSQIKMSSHPESHFLLIYDAKTMQLLHSVGLRTKWDKMFYTGSQQGPAAIELPCWAATLGNFM